MRRPAARQIKRSTSCQRMRDIDRITVFTSFRPADAATQYALSYTEASTNSGSEWRTLCTGTTSHNPGKSLVQRTTRLTVGGCQAAAVVRWRVEEYTTPHYSTCIRLSAPERNRPFLASCVVSVLWRRH